MRPSLKAFVFFLTLSLALGVFSQTTAVSRITQAIDDRDTVALRGSVHPMLQKAMDQGRMDGATRLEGVSLIFKRTAEQDAAAERFLEDLQNPSSPSYHKWLTPEQYADRFGISASDLAKVTAWLQSQDFTVNRAARGRSQVWFSGAVSQIETVFRTEMHHFSIKGESHFANSLEVSVPSALGAVVAGVHGLSNFRPTPRVRRNRALQAMAKPNFNFGGSTHFMSPDDFTTIYDVKALYSAGFDGTGQSIAVAGQTEVKDTDLNAFRTAAGLPLVSSPSNFERRLVPNTGTATIFSGDIGESSLDLEWSHGVAKGAKIFFVYTGNNQNSNVFDAFTFAIDNDLAPILSMSYGNCEQNLPSAFLTSVQQLTQQAAMQGQTIAAASGDFGAADCDTSPGLPAQGGLGVDIPGALPYVTSVGGTGFNGDLANPANFWNSSNNGVGGSAKSYIGETTWNDVTLVNALSAGGGGASLLFSKPSWQTGAGVPNDGARDVPDIALAAGPNHDGYMLCVNDPQASPPQLPCSSGFLDSTGVPDVAGGTSFGAPTFAGMVAILNQKTGSRQGNINPALYALSAANVGAFHDITSGSNIVPCDPATVDCPTSGTAQYGFSAGPGYDQVTGLGSIDAAKLVNNWGSSNAAVADFTMFGHVVGIAAPGGSGSSTITVEAHNGYSGTITFTCTAPSSAKVGCSVTGSPLTLNNGTPTGTVTLSITTAAAGLKPSNAPLWLGGSTAVFAGVLVLAIPAKRKGLAVAFTLITIALVLSAVGCGGSSSSGGGGNGTPAGTYTVSVTGTDGTTSHTTEVAVAVQ